MRKPNPQSFLYIVAALTACGPLLDADDPESVRTLRSTSLIDPPSATDDADEESPNGPLLGKKCIAYPNASGILGVDVTNVQISRSMLSGKKLGAGVVSGADFKGVNLPGTISGGALQLINIKDAKLKDGIYYYLVADSRGAPICIDDSGNTLWAVATSGTWSPTNVWQAPGAGEVVFTFSCAKSAIAKCIRHGLTPWPVGGAVTEEMKVAALETHQACTRMLRADYCGNGDEHTSSGLLVTFKTPTRDWYQNGDNSPLFGGAADWINEAKWNKDGATCVSSFRIGPVTCASKSVSTCSDFSEWGAKEKGIRLMNRSNPSASRRGGGCGPRTTC